MNQSKFAPVACFSPGYIANVKEGVASRCRFGGSTWLATGPRQDLGSPVLLVTLDLTDPVLSNAVSLECNLEIPLFSYINLDGLIPVQEYRLDQSKKAAAFASNDSKVKLLPIEHRLATPFPESFLRLRDIRDNEIAMDKESYWVAMDSFLGGEGPIRLCGAPLYIDNIDQKPDGFRYLASIGYESPSCTSNILPDGAFFLGELAHYFFISADWQIVRVVTQAA